MHLFESLAICYELTNIKSVDDNFMVEALGMSNARKFICRQVVALLCHGKSN